MRISLIFAVISLALIAQAQETTTLPTPNNGQLSPTRVTSTDEIIRLASQQRGNLSSSIFQFTSDPKVLPILDTLQHIKQLRN